MKKVTTKMDPMTRNFFPSLLKMRYHIPASQTGNDHEFNDFIVSVMNVIGFCDEYFIDEALWHEVERCKVMREIPDYKRTE